MSYLENINNHPNDMNVSLDEESHIYNIQGDKSFISTTTFIHPLFDKFDSDKIINNMMNSPNWTKNKYYGMTKQEIIDLWENNKIAAATAGTKLHADIENHYNKVNVDNESVEFNYFINFYNDYKNLLEPYRTEWIVYDKKFKIAGSIDMVFLNTKQTNNLGYEVLDIYDWKRSKEIVKINNFNKWGLKNCVSHLPDTNFWHYALQLNIYKYILEKNYNKHIGKMVLVCLHPNNLNNSYQLFEVPNLQNEICSLFNIL